MQVLSVALCFVGFCLVLNGVFDRKAFFNSLCGGIVLIISGIIMDSLL